MANEGGKLQMDKEPPSLEENHSTIPNTPLKSVFVEDTYLEDGPVFRATIKQLEDRTITLKASVKKIIKAATISLDLRRQLSKADEVYVEALRETQCLDPLMNHYLNNASKVIKDERLKLDQSFSSQLIEPLKKLYEEDIKVIELKRKQFEEESKDYYAALAKYLKKKGESPEEQKKQQQRKSRFDLARFDYLGFLLDIHGGRKESEIVSCVSSHTLNDFNFFESVVNKIGNEKNALNELSALMTDNSREQELNTLERATKRKELISLCNLDGGTISVDQQQKQLEETGFPIQEITPSADTEKGSHLPPSQDPASGEGPAANDLRFKGIRDLDQNRDPNASAGRKKEGFLFATSKPAKSTGSFDVKTTALIWHKYWCVLSGGQLHEYSNWKRQLESHIDPINLRFATVREARNSERRFCFEVITPHMRRIYQATSQEETESWIKTINNSIESLLNGTSSSSNLLDMANPTQLKRQGSSFGGAIKSGLAVVTAAANSSADLIISPTRSSSMKDAKRQSLNNSIQNGNTCSVSPPSPSEGAELLVSASNSSNDRFRWSGFSFGHHERNNSAGNGKLAGLSSNTQNQNGTFVFSSLPDSELSTKLLSILRQDPSNQSCADCQAKNPDWCSLNLGILLCIECSGIHRSLGTHISKIRSLTLDSTSYTPDIIELLKSMGNAKANAVWDPTTEEIPVPHDPRATKLAYIQAKYVKRAFVNPSEDPDQLLFSAIDHDDLPKAVQALASGANVNAPRPDIKTSPRISLLSDNSLQMHVFMPFLMDLDGDKIELSNEDLIVRYALHYALLHGRETDEVGRKLVYPMAELLFQNGADTGIVDPSTGHTLAELVGMGPVVDDSALSYINMKNTARGQSTITRSSTILNHHLMSIQQQQQLQHYFEEGKKEEGLSLIYEHDERI